VSPHVTRPVAWGGVQVGAKHPRQTCWSTH